ncbi:MAG: signal peptidase I [Spirochaetia bacterium]|jgi:signal peptidase I
MAKKHPQRALIAGLSWYGCILLTIALAGCPRFTGFYAVFLGLSLAILGSGLPMLNAVYRGGKSSLAPGFRKLTGYAIVAQYVALALPRVEWENTGLITDARAAFLYALTLLCTAAGIAFVILMTQDPSYPRRDKNARKARKRGIVVWVLEWVDALASAIIAVILIETFLFQLYQVPTESMVPIFLAGDRPFTVKLMNGPRLPLTELRLPFLREPGRGDVVTIANPRYPENSGVNLKKYLSQMIYMATFTLVNIDKVAADGTPKADPLVKRIVGVPGEKLMMVDDVLYSRTAAQPDYRPVSVDSERFAQIDLWKLPAAVRAKVQAIPVDERMRTLLAKWDAAKNGGDPGALASRLLDEWTLLSSHLAGMSLMMLSAFEQKQLPLANQGITTLRDAAMRFAPAGALNPISRTGAGTEDVSLALAVARSASARAALKEYVTAGAAGTAGPTAYERGSRNLNLIIKRNLLRRIDRDLVLIETGASSQAIDADTDRAGLIQEARELYAYLVGYYDMRNFPEFPAGAAFLGPDQYFAMGDNRYNSLDFRFSEKPRLRALDAADASSILYSSLLAPFPLEKRFIEGWAIFRAWPFSRLGAIR